MINKKYIWGLAFICLFALTQCVNNNNDNLKHNFDTPRSAADAWLKCIENKDIDGLTNLIYGYDNFSEKEKIEFRYGAEKSFIEQDELNVKMSIADIIVSPDGYSATTKINIQYTENGKEKTHTETGPFFEKTDEGWKLVRK